MRRNNKKKNALQKARSALKKGETPHTPETAKKKLEVKEKKR